MDERVELIDASDIPTNERRTLIALIEAADHQQSMPHHSRHEPEWRTALGEPPWPSWFQHQYWPSLDTVAFQAGITTATARRHLRLLTDRGVLVLLYETNQWIPGLGFRGPATYLLNLGMLSPRKIVFVERPRHEQSISANSISS